MAVYVDSLVRQRGRLWCHMAADSLDELHSMADLIGLRRSWFQDSNPRFPHYDLSRNKRSAAIKHGAIALTRVEMVIWNQDRMKKENML